MKHRKPACTHIKLLWWPRSTWLFSAFASSVPCFPLAFPKRGTLGSVVWDLFSVLWASSQLNGDHSFPLNPHCFWGSWGFVQGCVLLGWCISNELVPELNVFVVLSLSIEALESQFWTSVYLSTSLSCLYRHRNGSSCSPVGESSISSSSSVLQLLLSRHAWFSRDTNGAYCQLCMITGTTAFSLMACLEMEPGLEYVHFQTWQVKKYEMSLVDTFCSLQCG